MSDAILLYGAAGYSGRLILEKALALGLRPVLAGRDEAKLAPLAERFGLEFRVAPLTDAARLDAALRDMRVVLHAAGPFSTTAKPMVEACLRVGAHYLDITGEVSVIEELAACHGKARQRNVMVMPAVGFDVVASDCLAAHASRRLPSASRLAFGVRGLTLASRGSARTFVEQAGRGIRVRQEGSLVTIPVGTRERFFDYGDGPSASLAVSWGDVAAAYYTTGIPNLEVYFEATPFLRTSLAASSRFGWMFTSPAAQAFLKLHTDFLPEGPSEEERSRVSIVVVAEAEDDRGQRVRCRLRAPQAYSFTAHAAPSIAARVSRGDFECGFQTPARVYGPDLPLFFPGVSREDVA